MIENKKSRKGSLASRISKSGKEAQRLSRLGNRRKKRNPKAKHAQLQEKQKVLKAKRMIDRQLDDKESLDQHTIWQIERCQRDYNKLQDEIYLSSIYQDMARIETLLDKLPTRLAELRKQGFVFANYLEDKINVSDSKWDQIYDKIEESANREQSMLTREADRVYGLLQQALDGNKTRLARAKSAIQSLEQKARATQRLLRSRYSDIKQNMSQINSVITNASSAFRLLAEAKVDLLSTEYLVAACKAKMLDDANDEEGPKGILYLTDQRLLFEQKEEVTTKKFLFFTIKSEMVHEVRFAQPLGHIEELEAQDIEGFFSSQELLNLELLPQADRPYVTFELEGVKNEVWDALIQRVMTGEIEQERMAEAVEEKQAISQQVSQAPTICPTCGATLQAAILRGQNTIDCDYCGSVIRL